eukprot:2727783-Pleurochrysis_carterae.AAC.1
MVPAMGSLLVRLNESYLKVVSWECAGIETQHHQKVKVLQWIGGGTSKNSDKMSCAVLDGVHVPGTVENVVGAKSSVSEIIYAPIPHSTVPCLGTTTSPPPS